ncbi:MAG TPA: DUF167 domain-containing protein [Verrucomicrobiae bacterium]|nr:DUF167 domain-containing protein [Verrucomicrobiae bacterium]
MIYIVRIKFNSFDRFVLDDVCKEIELSIKSDPINGNANKEVIKKISAFFKVKSTDVKIIHGLRSTTKKIDITI